MSYLTRWLAPTALALTLGAGALLPTAAHASDSLIRVLVDLPDVVIRAGRPHYRYDDGYDTRLIVERDRYGRPVYYRYVPRDRYRHAPPYGNAYGYHRNHDDRRYSRYSRQRCDSRGRCRVEYYDPRYDDRYDDRYVDRYDDRHDDRYDHRRRRDD